MDQGLPKNLVGWAAALGSSLWELTALTRRPAGF